jgi:hypothetical protein
MAHISSNLDRLDLRERLDQRAEYPNFGVEQSSEPDGIPKGPRSGINGDDSESTSVSSPGSVKPATTGLAASFWNTRRPTDPTGNDNGC